MRLQQGLSVIATTFFFIAGCSPDAANEAAPLQAVAASAESNRLNNDQKFPNSNGDSETYNPNGYTDLDNDFFQDLGTNGRTCVTCHGAAEGWTIRPDLVQARFDGTAGMDPLFRTNDGSNSPNADVSTVEARRAAYSMLLSKAVIRVGIGIPAGAQFELVAVDDPYGHASAAELSLFRRPLPSANLPFDVNVMWDGRVSEGDLLSSLAAQANGATQGHAARPDPLSQSVRESIVDLEFDLFSAQSSDLQAAELHASGGRGGPLNLATETGVGTGFDIYDAWLGITGGGTEAARAAIARGQEIFNSKNCVNCHGKGNIGNDAAGRFFNVGISAPARRTPDMPLYTLRNVATGEVRQTTDPGRALITGLWSDVDRFKVPGLRALSSRAPYFHDGSISTLRGVVEHYNTRFNMNLTEEEKSDLTVFLGAL